ncbi:HD domain-containing protein [Geomonas sp. RF6]|uniref:HD domain-containing protein n=1 Tax=Geomonas sp. RF6 TaxID=2897342 RepID=UPI001E37ADB5|nr:HD domain-containing protein [Geomonas sp. RF6]UFS69076.1 HD domain-containing protein [Geomonas sp. RF6]
MTDEVLERDILSVFRTWFSSFCDSYREDDPEAQRNLDLKELHTLKVCEGARLIASGGSARRLLLAESAALFHDLGRFPQYRKYRTFKDSESVNHAHLSAQILSESGLLERLTPEEGESVLCAVRLHNAYLVPDDLTPQAADLLKIVRDADKLDIWRVFQEYYEAPADEKASAVPLGFPDEPRCSGEVLETLSSGRMVALSQLRTLNDFKLLQLSWVYDINFTATLSLVQERSLIDGVSATLPRKEGVLAAVERVKRYVEERVAAG